MSPPRPALLGVVLVAILLFASPLSALATRPAHTAPTPALSPPPWAGGTGVRWEAASRTIEEGATAGGLAPVVLAVPGRPATLAFGPDGPLLPVLPRELAFPVPTGDRDGDGANDLYLVELLAVGDPPTSRIVAASGRDGSTQAAYDLPTANVLRAQTLSFGDLTLDSFAYAVDEVPLDDGWTLILTATVAYDAATGREVDHTTQRYQAHEDGSASVWMQAMTPPGPYGDDETGAFVFDMTYHWGESFFAGVLAPEGGRRVALPSGEVRLELPSDAPLPRAVVPTAPTWSLLNPTRGPAPRGIEWRSGEDHALVAVASGWTLGFDVVELLPVAVGATAWVVATGQDPEGAAWLAAVAPDASIRWKVPAPPGGMDLLGHHRARGADVVGFLDGSFDCGTGLLVVDLAAVDAETGATRATRRETLDAGRMTHLSVLLGGGDVDGDGVSEVALLTHHPRDARFQGSDCSFFSVHTGPPSTRFEAWSMETGETILRLEREGALFPALSHHPGAPLPRLAFLQDEERGLWPVRERTLHIAEASTGAWIERSLGVRAFVPPWNAYAFLQTPLTLKGDGDDTFVAWWGAHSSDVAEHARYEVTARRLSDGAPLWAIRSAAPHDVDLLAEASHGARSEP